MTIGTKLIVQASFTQAQRQKSEICNSEDDKNQQKQLENCEYTGREKKRKIEWRSKRREMNTGQLLTSSKPDKVPKAVEELNSTPHQFKWAGHS